LDLEADANLSVFSTADPQQVSTATRLDAVGFGTNTGNTCDLLREGTTLPAVAAALAALPGPPPTPDYSYFRNLSTGLPADANDNSSDFLFADVADTLVLSMQRLGAPGPENLTSPVNRAATVKASLFDVGVASSAVPNRQRSATVVTNGANGTLVIRRTFTNSTGGTVTRLRFRVVDMTGGAQNGAAGSADLRLLDTVAGSTSVSGGGTKSWVAMTVEQPPTQAKGGGTNSTVVVNLGGGLTAGNSVNVEFTLGVQTPGNFRFFVLVEALP
jgi:hypothetical protein